MLKPLNRQFFFLKGNFVPYLSNHPKKTQMTCSPNTLPLFSHKRPIPPQKCLLNSGWQHPQHTEHREKQRPKSLCLYTVEENVIY